MRQCSDSYHSQNVSQQLELVWDLSPSVKEVDCAAPRVVINESDIVPYSANRPCQQWTTYVTICTNCSLLIERIPLRVGKGFRCILPMIQASPNHK